MRLFSAVCMYCVGSFQRCSFPPLLTGKKAFQVVWLFWTFLRKVWACRCCCFFCELYEFTTLYFSFIPPKPPHDFCTWRHEAERSEWRLFIKLFFQFLCFCGWTETCFNESRILLRTTSLSHLGRILDFLDKNCIMKPNGCQLLCESQFNKRKIWQTKYKDSN